MKEIDIRDIFRVLLDKIIWIVLVPFVAVSVATVYVYYFAQPTYSTGTTLYIITQQDANTALVYADLTISTQLVSDYKELVDSKRVVKAMKEALGMSDSVFSQYKVSVEAKTNTRIIQITVSGPDPATAANISNMLAEQFAKAVVEIMDVNNVNIIDPAEPPTSPSAPNKLRTIAIAGLAALVLVAGIIIAIEMLNNTIRTDDDVQRILDLPVLARVPKMEDK